MGCATVRQIGFGHAGRAPTYRLMKSIGGQIETETQTSLVWSCTIVFRAHPVQAVTSSAGIALPHQPRIGKPLRAKVQKPIS